MKMIVSILQDSDKDSVLNALNEANFQATLLPSTGGYFRRGNATLMIGVDDDQVEPALQVIRNVLGSPEQSGVKRATVFVMNVDQFIRV
jgi:uncharacterized protein YaaQ